MEAMQFNMLYVLPTEENMPPRCLMGYIEHEDELRVPTPEELENTVMAIFSPDDGCWTLAGQPLPPELSDKISHHAHLLGVPGF